MNDSHRKSNPPAFLSPGATTGIAPTRPREKKDRTAYAAPKNRLLSGATRASYSRSSRALGI
jgi:hypothetical protein